MVRKFIHGVGYAFYGIKEFAFMPRLWLYALIPFLIVLISCFFIIRALFVFVGQPLADYVGNMAASHYGDMVGGMAAKTCIALIVFAFVLVSAAVKNSLYELFGAVFLARMIWHYEHLKYGYALKSDVPFSEDFRNTLACVRYAAGTLFLSIFFFILGLCIPTFGTILGVIVIGKRYGIGYCSEAGFNKHLSLKELRKSLSGENKWGVYGFGIASLLLLMVPFVSILFIPGLSLGGTALVHDTLKD